MRLNLSVLCTLFTAVISGGCAVSASTDAPTENVGQTSDALSVYQWSADAPANNSHSHYPASIATFTTGGLERTYMIHTGNDTDDHSIYWAESDDGITWNSDHRIPAMATLGEAHIAAFNGNLYLLHTGLANWTTVWMSRFNAATGTWGQDFLTPYTSWEAPSMVSFNGALYIVGTHPDSSQVWAATMSTSEVFGNASDVPGMLSFGGSPSLAVHCPGSFCVQPTLYMASHGAYGYVNMTGLPSTLGRRGAAPTWWTPWTVVNTDGSTKTTTTVPALASYGGDLHLVYTSAATGDLIKWTYYDGSNWSPDVSIGSQEMSSFASLAARSNRLVMVHPSSAASFNNGDVAVYAEYFQ